MINSYLDQLLGSAVDMEENPNPTDPGRERLIRVGSEYLEIDSVDLGNFTNLQVRTAFVRTDYYY